MAKRSDAIPADRRVTLVDAGGVTTAVYVWKRYRFMFDDGMTVDVIAIQDDSDLRAAVREKHNDRIIVGAARVPEETTDDAQ